MYLSSIFYIPAVSDTYIYCAVAWTAPVFNAVSGNEWHRRNQQTKGYDWWLEAEGSSRERGRGRRRAGPIGVGHHRFMMLEYTRVIISVR